MANVSPGVYSKIIDLSEYVQAVPSTIGFMCSLTEKGEDNKLKFFGSRSEFISECGEPNISKYGKNYGQGPYLAYNFLGESGALFHIRCLPDDATYSNLLIYADMDPVNDATCVIGYSYVDSANTLAEIKTALTSTSPKFPLGILRPIGRGEYYNGISVRFTEHSNPLLNGVYVLDVYEKQSDGDDVIVESFEISFDPTALSTNGDSIWITYILEMYSSLLRFEMIKADESYAEGYDYVAKVFDKNIGTVTLTTGGSATLKDTKQVFTDWEKDPETGMSSYMVVAKDARGYNAYGWMGAANAVGDEVNIFSGRNLSTASRGWVADSAFTASSTITYEIRKSNASVAEAFVSAEPAPLRKGSDGAIRNEDGSLDTVEATEALAGGYAGILTNPLTSEVEDGPLDTENVYFTMVFDAGYPDDVKTQISTLVQTRRDCVALMDNGDNSSYTNAMNARLNNHTFNNYFCALYESYNKVYDIFTGQDMWVSPIYHMSYLAPRNDNVAELWYAIAGYNRGAIDSIKELRYSPKLGQRDQMYLRQLNPIVKFSDGYVVWGQLTSQAKASAMQDLNIVRLVLYIKRAFEQFCRYFIFEQNDALTWSKVANQMVMFLEDIKKRRGLYSYTVEVSATEYEKKTKQFHANVTLEPTRVVERINLNFFIK